MKIYWKLISLNEWVENETRSCCYMYIWHNFWIIEIAIERFFMFLCTWKVNSRAMDGLQAAFLTSDVLMPMVNPIEVPWWWNIHNVRLWFCLMPFFRTKYYSHLARMKKFKWPMMVQQFLNLLVLTIQPLKSL